jgi:hypothetical protein
MLCTSITSLDPHPRENVTRQRRRIGIVQILVLFIMGASGLLLDGRAGCRKKQDSGE